MENNTTLSTKFLVIASQTILFETGGDKEGGYTNDPSDSGGETRWGISKRAHPEVDIKNLSFEGALFIYERDYWNKSYEKLDSTKLLFKLYDMGVLTGKKNAVKILQKSINSAGKLVLVDGIIGPITIAAINSLDPDLLYDAYLGRLESYFKRISFLRPKNKKYLKGWLARLSYTFK